MDPLDPADAPGASSLEPTYPGLGIGEAVRMLQGLRSLNVVGGDVVCLMPIKDSPNQITAMNAMVVMFEIVCLMADRMKSQKTAEWSPWRHQLPRRLGQMLVRCHAGSCRHCADAAARISLTFWRL